MKYRTLFAAALAASTALTAVAPSYGFAQTQAELQRRQQKKNEWRNLAYVGGLLAVLGLTNKNSTLTGIGVVGALYSVSRYEADRKSQSKLQRTRAQVFAQPSFVHNGVRYVRKTVWKSGKMYYTFVPTK
ncbi:MAG TPA: hypothetical protein VK934_02110 [Fimbriimonas sp.]|nr:hypothetical protein [Fimbriimonas sp.]